MQKRELETKKSNLGNKPEGVNLKTINHTMFSVRELLREGNQIATEPSFERPYGCWKQSNINGYLRSVFLGHNASPIVLTDVSNSRTKSVRNGNKASSDYFDSHIKNNMNYVSIDGKHRCETIIDFVSDNCTYSGPVFDELGNSRNVRARKFSQLSNSEQLFFLGCTISVAKCILMKQEMSSMFISVNDGVALTPQHKRNAIQTPFASWIRNLYDKNRDTFMKIYSDDKIAAMEPHQFMSRMFMHVDKSSCNITNSSLDDLYSRGVDKTFKEVYSQKSQKICEEVFDTITEIQDSRAKKVHASGLICLALVVQEVVSRSLTITDHSLFYEKVMQLDRRLHEESVVSLARAIENGEEITERDYYHEWRRTNWQSTRSLRQATLWNKISKNLDHYCLKA